MLTHGSEASASSAPTAGSVAVRTAVPALLVVVALVQAALVHTADLTPWKGGGFGMFAAVDRSEHRAVRVYLRTPDGEVPAVLADPVAGQVTADARVVRARNLPTDRSLAGLAASLGAQAWTLQDEDGTQVAVTREAAAASSDALTGEAGGTDPAEADDEPAGPPLTVQAVRIEVWKLGVEAGGTRIAPRLLADAVEELP